MPDNREHALHVQAGATAVITARVAHDPAFADEFIGVVEGGYKGTLEAFARSAGVNVSEVEVIVIDNGICICKGRACTCIIYRAA